MMTAGQPGDAPPPQRARARGVRDIAIRAVGIPFFGLIIPRLTHSFGELTWRDRDYWIGTGWFLALSFVLWQGNRWLLLRRRDRSDWLAEPVRTLAGLLLGHVVFTIPTTTVAMMLWYMMAPFPAVDWLQVGLVSGVVMVAVLLVTHGYETMFLIHDRLEDRLDLERTERARLQAELGLMKSQLAPHFLFNCLNALGILIEENPAMARRYNQHMARVCRYLLVQQRRDLVPLSEELAFFDDYAALVRLRFASGLGIELRGVEAGEAKGWLIPPAALQLLLENATKHNVFSERDPLLFRVELRTAVMVVSNPLRPVPGSVASTGTGLKNLCERCQFAAGVPVRIESEAGEFRVTLPLVRAGQN